ncbi:peptidase T [Vibrio vulnificus]|nr:peptidase T [Vibrio vulnificus]EHU9455908.1 peptidase T [Vibrio vulnificus]
MSTYEIVSTIVIVISIGINLYQFRARKPKLKIRLIRSLEPNIDGVGNYLCARIFVSNHGGEAAYYGGLEAVDDKGNIFYPSCSLKAQKLIPPNASIVGVIPNGHLLCDGTKKLFVVDGTLSKYKLSSINLRRTIKELKEERQRLESLGYKVHPNTSWSS